MFQIWSLVNRCSQFLIQSLELDNCVDILTLGDRSDPAQRNVKAMTTFNPHPGGKVRSCTA